jgi:ABC-2 type transport system permease protein
MIRAIQLEWLKLKHYKLFWVLLVMYVLALIIITSGGVFLLEWMKSKGVEFEGIDPTIIPIYDFPDIWQNSTYLASFTKLLLAFIVIISVNNDLTYLTLRQNIIDGLSKWEYLLSKLGLIIVLALFSVCFLFLSGLINGYFYSHVWGTFYIFDELEYLLAYGWEIVVYCTLAFLISLLIKKSGFVIVFLFLYTLMFEPILVAILENHPNTKFTFWADFAQFFPIKSLNNLISIPFGRYILQEIQDSIPPVAFFITLGWFVVYLSLIMLFLIKKDLK